MKKIGILELDVSTIKNTFVSYSPGIWQKTLTVPETEQLLSPINTVFGATWVIDSAPVDIGSMRIDDITLGTVGSIEELYLQDGSFYLDVSSQVIYIALYNYENAYNYHEYNLGEIVGFISEAQKQEINGEIFPIDTFLGSRRYSPVLDGGASAEESLDDQSAGIFIYDDLKASLRNDNGDLDLIRDDVTGNLARYLVADLAESEEESIAYGVPYKLKASPTDFNVARIGIVDDIDYSNPNLPKITAIDQRLDWSQKIGINLLTTSEYTNLEDKYINKRKPLCIGQVAGVECVQLSPNPISSTNTDFLICDTSIGDIQSISQVYFDGKISGADVDRALSVGEYSVDLETGVLTVNNFDKGKAWVSGIFTELTETVEIVLFLLSEYANLPYITNNFNIPEIEEIRALGYETHVYVSTKGDSLNNVVEKLVMDIQIDFFQQGRVLTMRKSNEEREYIEEIFPSELLSNPTPWVNDRTDTIKTITATYNRDYRTDESDTYYDDSNEDTALDNNRKAVDITFETNLINQADVAEIYGEYYNRFIVSSRTVTLERLGPFRAGLTDFILHQVERETTDGTKIIFIRGVYKIIKIDKTRNYAEAVYFSDMPEDIYLQGYAGAEHAGGEYASGPSLFIEG